MKFLYVCLSLMVFVAAANAQGNDLMNMMMMMNLMNRGGSSSSSGSSSGSSGRPGASGSAGGLGALLGSRGGAGGLPALAMMGGSDRMRDMMMCNMMPRAMRSICMMRAFQ